jgi:hypothetical protein
MARMEEIFEKALGAGKDGATGRVSNGAAYSRTGTPL